MDKEVFDIIPEKELYARTGIQKAIYNTIYQLMALKKKHPEQLERAETMLMMPDYFHFRLSGKKVQEYSEATTSQLVDPRTRNWDYELIEKLVKVHLEEDVITHDHHVLLHEQKLQCVINQKKI